MPHKEEAFHTRRLQVLNKEYDLGMERGLVIYSTELQIGKSKKEGEWVSRLSLLLPEE